VCSHTASTALLNLAEVYNFTTSAIAIKAITIAFIDRALVLTLPADNFRRQRIFLPSKKHNI